MELSRRELSLIRYALRDYHAKVRRGDVEFDKNEDLDTDYEIEQLHYEVHELREKVVNQIKENGNGS